MARHSMIVDGKPSFQIRLLDWCRHKAGRSHRDISRPSMGRLDSGRALVAASLLVPAIVLALAAWQSRRLAWREAEARVERTVLILQEHAVKVFETHKLVIDQVNGRLRFVNWDSEADRADLHRMLKQIQLDLDQVAAVTVTDAEGRLRASSRAHPADPRISFADRDWFQALRAADGTPAYVSRSYSGRQSGRPVFNVAGRVTSAASGGAPGGFDGAVAISVDRNYFETFYRSVETRFSHLVVLIRDDGQVLAREPVADTGNVPASAAFVARIKASPTGSYVATSSVDGSQRLFSYRQIARYPVFVGFGIDVEAALAPWRDDMAAYSLVAALAAGLLLAVSLLANARARREREATLGWEIAAAGLRAEAIERERVEAQLRQAQKMEAVGRLTGGVAHDFNNLLTVIVGSLDLLRRRMTGADERHLRLLGNALDGAHRAAALTARLLAFSRQQPLAPEIIDANRLVAGMSDLLRRTLGETIAVETVLAGGLWSALADPNQLESALLNLAVNARDAMPDGGTLTIETGNADLDDAYAAANEEVSAGEYVMVAVRDTGSGIAPEVLARVFEPFFTTKAVGKGTGLGLSQVYGFTKQSGGHAAIDSEPGHGTRVKLYLPRSRDADVGRDADPVHVEATVPAASGELILVVEDDAAVRDLSVGILREAGHRVVEAEDGTGGLAHLRAHPEIALLFTDVVLAGSMNGRQLADAALVLRPGLPVLFTTGYTKNTIIHHGRLDEGVNLLTKPFTPDALRSKVGSLLDKAAAVAGDGRPDAGCRERLRPTQDVLTAAIAECPSTPLSTGRAHGELAPRLRA